MNAASTELADKRNIGTFPAPDDNTDKKGCCCCWSSKRYFLFGMLFVGAISIRLLDINFNVLILDIVLDSTISDSWNYEGGKLLRNMFICGFLTSIIVAQIARKFGPVSTYGYALLLAGVVTILHPYILQFNFNLLLAARFLEGSLLMACHVATADILSRWSSKRERFKMVSFVISGTYVGNDFVHPLCERLVQVYGWRSMFYCTGAIAVLISSTILLLFRDNPPQDKCISKNELELLTRELQDSSNEKITHLWKKILTAKPLWALLVTKIGLGCSIAFYNSYVQAFLIVNTLLDLIGKQFNFDYIIIVMTIAAILTLPAAGLLADYLQNSKILTATQLHKTYIATGSVLGAMCFFGINLTSNLDVAIVWLRIFKILLSLGQLTTTTLLIYMAPRHSGLIAAIVSYGSLIGVFIGLTLTQFISDTFDVAVQGSLFIAAHDAIALSAAIIFLLFGSSDVLEIFRTEQSPENGHNREPLLGFEMKQNKGVNTPLSNVPHRGRISTNITYVLEKVTA